jgi:hypothetical protein
MKDTFEAVHAHKYLDGFDLMGMPMRVQKANHAK